MCTVRSGRWAPTELTAGSAAMSPPWSSSITIASLGAARRRAPPPATADVIDAGRVVGARLQEHRDRIERERGAQALDRHALVVDVDADHLGAELLEQVEQRREGRVLDDHAVAEADDDLGDSVERVHRAVDHGELLRGERPALAQHLLERGQHRVVEVAARQR